LPLTGWQDSKIDNGQGSETVKVGDTELTVKLGEETEGKSKVTEKGALFTVGLTF
jgi:hypothetical protein